MTIKNIMKQITLVTVVLLITNIITFAQKIEWEKNGLTWDDFKGKPNLDVQFQSELNYYVGYNTDKQKQNDTIIRKYKSYLYMNSGSSWVTPNSKTDDLLLYNQVLFDIIELHKRKFQHTMNLTANSYEIESKFSIYYQECNERLNEFKSQSEYGKKNSIVKFWSETINKELDLTTNEIIPKFTKGIIGYGMHIGLGYGTPIATLSNHFNGHPLLVYGFDLKIKKFIIFANGVLGGGKIKKDYSEGMKLWKNGERFDIAIVDLSCGYTLIDNSKHKISPFAGFGIVEYTSGRQDEKDNANKLRLTDYNLIAGLNYDYKFRKILKITPNAYFINYKELLELSIRTRLYVTPTTYYSDLKGMTINFSIGICGLGQRIKIID